MVPAAAAAASYLLGPEVSEAPGGGDEENGVKKGVAPLTLLVSAGGVAAASKRPFLLSGSPCFVALVSSFGRREK